MEIGALISAVDAIAKAMTAFLDHMTRVRAELVAQQVRNDQAIATLKDPPPPAAPAPTKEG